jgi:hypothetical protein
MKTVITLIMLATCTAYTQNMSIQRGRGGYSDGPELVTQVPRAITAGEDLDMYALVPSVYTNITKNSSSIRITVTHNRKIAQKPAVMVAQYTPALIRELYKLRDSFIGKMNQVAYDSADVKMEGMPTVTTGYGHRRTNIFQKSKRDKENIEHRAEQSAILQLNRLTSSLFRVPSYGMTDRITHHYRLPDGQYMLCVIQKVKDPDSSAMLGSKTAIWWTKFVIEKDKPKELILDETNAITWREIFKVKN